MKKIYIITSTKTEFSLLQKTATLLHKNSATKLQLIITDTHLSQKFNNTIEEIENSGLPIKHKIPFQLEDQNKVGISKTMADIQSKFTNTLNKLKPDLIILLNNHFEILPITNTTLILDIPITHIHKKKHTENTINNSIKHSITKLSHLHFYTTNKYKNHLIQLKKNPQNIFNIRALYNNNILKTKTLSKNKIEENLKIKLKKTNYLFTFHPKTHTENSKKKQLSLLLDELSSHEDTFTIFTYPNTNHDSQFVINQINKYIKNNPENSITVKSLKMLRYLSILKVSNKIIGNSSNNILKAPFYNTPTLNIKDRQKKRLRTSSIIDCNSSSNNIKTALDKMQNYNKKSSNSNPFKTNKSTRKIIETIINTNLKKLTKKQFFDLN